ncbi:RNA polymerase sigma factor [Flavitalea flava]
MNDISIHEEKALIAQVAKSDENAFRMLFARYRHKVFYIARKLLQSDSLAEDVLQEIFLKIWIHREQLPEINNFRAYLNTITRNHIYNALRKLANEEKLIGGLATRYNSTPAGTDQSTAIQTLSYQELQGALQKAIANLTPQQRKTFELSRLEGLRHDEIAVLLNISKETVKKHISEALHTLRKQLRTHESLVQLLFLLFFTSL